MTDSGSLSKPPVLKPEKYSMWRYRMEAFMMTLDKNLYKIVCEGPYVPMGLVPTIEISSSGKDGEGGEGEGDRPQSTPRYMPKPSHTWTDEETRLVNLDAKARGIIIMALPDEVFHTVTKCLTAKEIWESLEVQYIGTKEVKKNRRAILIRTYEGFASKAKESLTETFTRFNCLINDLREAGKVYDNEDMLRKFMQGLPSEFDMTIQAIRHARNLER